MNHLLAICAASFAIFTAGLSGCSSASPAAQAGPGGSSSEAGRGGTASGGTASGGRGGDTGGATSDAGGGLSGGRANVGGSAAGAQGGSGGSSIGGGTGGSGVSGSVGMTGGAAGTGGMSGNSGPAMLVTCPSLPGATPSPLYSVTIGDKPLFVEKLTKFSPQMQVHYAHGSLSGTGTATVAVTVSESFSSYTVSPKSRKLAATKSGNTITFATGPNYLILKFDSKELLFILLDAEETNPPKIGDASVKNLADYNVDNTGASLVTAKIQAAIDAASGAAQNTLYVPPGKYKVGELWLKSNMTLYLACGAVLYGSGSTSDFNTGSGGIDIEGMQHSLIRMYQLKNTKISGRGVLDANGLAIRAAGLNASLMKIEQSSAITIDGIVVRDSSYWDTLIYRSDQVTLRNYKVINGRPTTTVYNNTDGVDFDESTNGILSNAFLYTGDDAMATKNEEASGTVNTKNILHEHVVLYTNSAGCKIGTKTMGQTMDGVVFKDIDVVKAGRALVIDGADTAVVQNTTFEDIRIEAADSTLVDVQNNNLPSWRTAAGKTLIKETFFTNVSSDVRKSISLQGASSSVTVTGVHFKNFTVQGSAISQSDVTQNTFVSGVDFK
ncbi:MAG TPA: glycosyl hydrolase family 28 protein [Polyangiaceae bacterium]|nr:glycosyl hydrolase family 28 protein [Polyangiaceae bacterium]